MVRIIIKGGVWKNTEDEVLKAAIAKYGKNQWARISSLLVRKTPKQCKARWYEWLDPSIKKTEWSKTEDEKLLHLAKIMPTQWRTIAPIVGRTATQCLERYQKLLDEAEAKENEELGLAGPSGTGPSADDVRRLRPGEIDPDPETKPARPDYVDMDEDEKEMLSEARARLANTQGKKAKRKARERQLEEARRLAVLQKKRELKAAGIIMRHKTKRKGMDYNADIPFEKKPAAGFYDTSEEQARIAAAPVGQSLRRLENKRKPDEEEAERKKRQRKVENDGPHQTKFLAARDAQIQKLKEAESIGRRRELLLPVPQVTEAEFDEIVKIGQAGESAKTLVAGGSDASGRLLSEYEGLENARMARTPRTVTQQDTVMMEARNLRSMTITQTPLLGEENTPLHVASGGGTGFESSTPRHQVAFTPNPLATPRSGSTSFPTNVPPTSNGVSATPLRTPRDNLSINSEDYPSIEDTPRDQRLRVNATKRALQEGFMNLPKPENNFELLVPDDDSNDAEQPPRQHVSEEDAAQRDARVQRIREEEEKKALARRSGSVRQNLPRPANVDMESLFEQLSVARSAKVESTTAQQLLDREVVHLMHYDSITYPLPGTTKPGGEPSTYELPHDEDVVAATSELQQELGQILGLTSPASEDTRRDLSAHSEAATIDPEWTWALLRTHLVFNLQSHTWTDLDKLNPEERVAGYSALLKNCRETISQSANKAAKAEKKLAVLLGGYQTRSQSLSKRITTAFDELQKAKVEQDSFSHLQVNETVGGPRRVASLKEEVERLERRELHLQARYAELDGEKRAIEERIITLEEQLMADAEAMNEAALAQMEGVES